jgi:hypothetical protein
MNGKIIFLLVVFEFLLHECWVCSNWLACLFLLFDFGDGWSDVGVRMTRGAPGGSATSAGSNAEPAQALAAHALQENLRHGQEPRPRAPWLWWVYSVHDNGTWTAAYLLASLCGHSTSIIMLLFIPCRVLCTWMWTLHWFWLYFCNEIKHTSWHQVTIIKPN